MNSEGFWSFLSGEFVLAIALSPRREESVSESSQTGNPPRASTATQLTEHKAQHLQDLRNTRH